MAVTGSGQGNAMSYNPYHRGRIGQSGETPGFEEAYLHRNGASVQGAVRTPANPKIDPASVDPENASYEEIQALNAYLVEKGLLKEQDLDSFERPTKDDTQKADYLGALRKWRDTQFQVGNMVGYSNAARVCDAWSNAASWKNGTTTEINGTRFYLKEGRLTSGIIGFGTLADGTTYSAGYASSSTVGKPVIEVRMQGKNGKEELYMVSPREVDPENASELEMFAQCSYLDSQGISDSSRGNNTYQKLLAYAQYSTMGDRRAQTADSFKSGAKDWTALITDSRIEELDKNGKVDASWGKVIQEALAKAEKQNGDQKRTEGRSESELWSMAIEEGKPKDNGVPYYYMAKDGIIEYNGVVFFCDEERRAICLGDTSDKRKCLNIPLSGGGSLIVNRDNLGDLAHAIGMFSPEDVNLIMRAIAEDAKIQQIKQQIEDEKSGLDLAEQTGGDGTEGDETVMESVLGEPAAGEAGAKEPGGQDKAAENSAENEKTVSGKKEPKGGGY